MAGGQVSHGNTERLCARRIRSYQGHISWSFGDHGSRRGAFSFDFCARPMSDRRARKLLGPRMISLSWPIESKLSRKFFLPTKPRRLFLPLCMIDWIISWSKMLFYDCDRDVLN